MAVRVDWRGTILVKLVNEGCLNNLGLVDSRGCGYGGRHDDVVLGGSLMVVVIAVDLGLDGL